MAKTTKVKLAIYNSLGQELQMLVNAVQEKGEYVILFDGGKLSSGIYYYRLNANNNILTGKMLLVK